MPPQNFTIFPRLLSAFSLVDSSYSGNSSAATTYDSAPLPGLYIKPLDTEIPLPLTPENAEKILPEAVSAPYGLGTETIIDKAVCDSVQLDAIEIELRNPRFREWIDNVALPEACEKLGVAEPGDIQAQLYKLLLYSPGGHFDFHQE